MHDQRTSVFDYLHEHASIYPQHAGNTGYALSERVLSQALHAIPDEYHVPAETIGERFVQSVIAEATARKVDAYHVAEFALDIVPV